VRGFGWAFSCCGNTINVGGLQPSVGHGIERGVRMKRDLRHVWDFAEFSGFRRPDNGN